MTHPTLVTLSRQYGAPQKNLTSLAVAILVDQGYLNFSDRISQHWPEFGQYGKAGIMVADMLRHEGGLSTIAAKLDVQDCFPENLRSNRVAQVLEKELPHWPGDCRREYHAITRGAVIQELFRRVDPKGRSIGQFLREELLIDLEADVYIGLSEADQREKHIADLRAFPAAELKTFERSTNMSSQSETSFYSIFSAFM